MRRLILFIIIFASFLAFIVLNLENRSDISLGFAVFRNVPVFLGIFFSFALGILFSIPLGFSSGRHHKKAAEKENPDLVKTNSGKAKKKRWGIKSGNDNPVSGPYGRIQIEETGSDQIKKESGPYGID